MFRNQKTGEIKLLLESMDDLWHLHNILEVGDLAFAMTYRRDETSSDKLRPERGQKKPMKLGIEVEKVEFHEFSDRLRVHGIIKEGPQDLGSYHTFNLESGDKLTIVKEKWKDHHLKRIEEAVKATDQPTSLFIAIDYDEATFAILRQSGPQELFHITSQVSGKQYKQSGDQKKTFYEEILSRLKQVMEEPKPVILVGPGFAKEEFIALAKEKEPELFENFIVKGTGQGGMTGIHEALKEGIASRAIENSRVRQETMLIEQLLTEIAKDGKCAYGPNEVENALISGAVEILLLTDTSVREKRVEKLLKLAGETKVRIVIVSISHDAGKKLQALGDVGALLRYKMYT
jgi:protein pelota